MFDRIGSFSSRFRVPIVVFWAALTLVAVLFTPNLSDAIVSDQSTYLPEGEPSVVAAQIAAEYFPEQSSSAQAVLVLQSVGSTMHDPANQAFLSDLTAWLEGDQAPPVVGKVASPAQEEMAERLISADGQVAMVFVALHGAVDDPDVLDALDVIRVRLEAAPEGLTGYVTGSVAMLNEYLSAAMESVDRTTVITIALVVVILLAIYRSALSPMVPLVTIGVAFLVSRGLVAWLSRFGWTVSSFTELFMVVLLFGAGTDYCLFLVSRFREYVADELPGPVAARRTVGRVGETITSSAGTVIVGMVAMSFAKMGLFASTGPSLALSIVVALLAGLTLTPALLALMGRWAFWPGGARFAQHSKLWVRLSHAVVTRPWVPLALAVAVLIPLAVYGGGQQRNFDLMSDLPGDAPSKVGFAILSEAFGAGEMQPLDVVVTDMPGARTPEGLAFIDTLTTRLLAAEGVADVRSLTLPAGDAAPELGQALRVESQLGELLGSIGALRDQVTDPAALGDVDLDAALSGLDRLRAYLEELSAAFPDLEGDADLSTALQGLGDLEASIASSLERLLVSKQLAEAAQGLAAGVGDQDLWSRATEQGMEAAVAQLGALRAYLAAVSEAHPQVADMDGYGQAIAALDELQAATAEIGDSLLVSTQLDLLAEGLADMAASLSTPDAIAELAAVSDPSESMALLATYLQELAAAHPSLAALPSYQSAVGHLAGVAAAVDELAKARLVSAQLDIAAQQMGETAQALAANPLSLMPQPGEPGPAEQMAALERYLGELATAYPSLGATEDYQAAVAITAEMAAALQEIDLSRIGDLVAQLTVSMQNLGAAFQGLSATAAATLPEATFFPEAGSDLVVAFLPDVSGLTAELTAAQGDLAALAEEVRTEMPHATFVPETALLEASAQAPGLLPATDSAGLLSVVETSLPDLSAALQGLSDQTAAVLPEAAFVPPAELLAVLGETDSGAILAGLEDLTAGLTGLAGSFAGREGGFFVPQALTGLSSEGMTEDPSAGLQELLDTYTTEAGDATRIQIVLTDDPFSPAAMDTVARLRAELGEAGVAHISGTSAVSLDLKQVMDRDYFRTMFLVIGGVSIVLLLLLRSLVAPVYLMATILLSYGATMGITRLVFDGIFGYGIAWFAPFLIFVVLVALGMDYNIFLMGRVKEEVAGNGTKAGIQRAVERTGGIITSAGIIMAGTFAAMMASSLLGLVQIAFAVTVGILLDTFVIRTSLVPAIATLLGKWNWWPGRGPARR